MNSIEKQLVEALRLANADTQEKRHAVYEKAINAAQKMQPDSAQRVLDAIGVAIRDIEAMMEPDQAPLSSEQDVHVIPPDVIDS